jgi:IS5 family transposase
MVPDLVRWARETALAAEDSLLVALLRLIDQMPVPPAPAQRGRGRPCVYADRLFLKAVVIMVVKRLPRVGTLLAVLAEPTPEMTRLRALLTDGQGRFPTRRTWERRLRRVPDTLPAQIGCLGRGLVALLEPGADTGRGGAMDSTVLVANGGVWHRKHREAGIVPHTSIDTEAGWTKSGWHGWVYGWKLHVVVTVASVWIPLAAELTPANVADNEVAPALLRELPPELHFLLADKGYDDGDLRTQCAAEDVTLVTARRGAYPHADAGKEVRRVFHQLRSHAVENWNEHVKALFDAHRPVPTRGLVATRRFALGAVLVYQLLLLHRFLTDQPVRTGLKAALLAP